MRRNFIVRSVFVVAICSAFFICFLLLPFKDEKIDDREKETASRLSMYEKQDVTLINEHIQSAKNTIALNNVSQGTISWHMRFSNAVVLGDSIAEGLTDYSVLSANNVIGIRGKKVNSIQEDINVALAKAPKVIFLEYGLNDLKYYHANYDAFIDDYTTQIRYIKSKSPTTKIYINSILPISQEAISKEEDFKYYKDYNNALKKMCKKEKITFIDNAFIIENMDMKYEYDGVHPKYAFYPNWVANMALVSGL